MYYCHKCGAEDIFFTHCCGRWAHRDEYSTKYNRHTYENRRLPDERGQVHEHFNCVSCEKYFYKCFFCERNLSKRRTSSHEFHTIHRIAGKDSKVRLVNVCRTCYDYLYGSLQLIHYLKIPLEDIKDYAREYITGNEFPLFYDRVTGHPYAFITEENLPQLPLEVNKNDKPQNAEADLQDAQF